MLSNRKITLAVILISFSFILSGCSKKPEPSAPKEKTLSTYPSGAKKVTALVREKESTRIKIKSFEYYESGEKKKEYDHLDNLYFGQWTFWYKDGQKLADGRFVRKAVNPAKGIGNGMYYWHNGKPMIKLESRDNKSKPVVVAVYDESGKQYTPENQPEGLRYQIRETLERWEKGEL